MDRFTKLLGTGQGRGKLNLLRGFRGKSLKIFEDRSGERASLNTSGILKAFLGNPQKSLSSFRYQPIEEDERFTLKSIQEFSRKLLEQP